MRQIRPRGGTALYDAVAEAVMMAEEGRRRKKAVVVISDGNDTNSETDVREMQQLIRETEVLVYAIRHRRSRPVWRDDRETEENPHPAAVPDSRRGRGVAWPPALAGRRPNRSHGRPGERVGPA